MMLSKKTLFVFLKIENRKRFLVIKRIFCYEKLKTLLKKQFSNKLLISYYDKNFAMINYTINSKLVIGWQIGFLIIFDY